MKRQLAYFGVFLLGGFALSFGCLATGGKVTPVTAHAADEAKTATRSPSACDEGCARIPGIDLEAIVAVLDDPRLSAAKQASLEGRSSEAARAIEAALEDNPPSGIERRRWEYQLGRFRALSQEWAAAAQAFDAATAEDWPLVPYARLGAAQAYARLGQYDEALSRARDIADGSPIRQTAQLLVADILAARGDRQSAIPIWREQLEGKGKPPGWPLIALQLAEALLEDRPTTERAEEAANLARRVIVEAPTTGSATRATDVFKRALARLPESRSFPTLKVSKLGEVSAPLSPLEHVARASSLASAGRNGDALKTIDAVLAMPRSRLGDEADCKANLLRAQILLKQRERPKASDAYGVAIERCERIQDALPEALFGGGKAASAANRCDEAMERYARLERELPTHRYADDARLRGAICALDRGDSAKHEAMLATIADDYPQGDMASDGLFRLALSRMVAGDWAAASKVLERSIETWPSDRRYWAAGRALYFRGKALAKMGQEQAARDAWASVVSGYPLSYYMLKAYARLAESDANKASRLLDEALSREPQGPFELADLPIFHGAGFARVVELVRAGEIEPARREVQALDLNTREMPSDALWAVALIYAQTGSAQLTHALPRALLEDWLEHYPVGRWRKAWELAYPRPYSELVTREAEKSGIDASLAYAVMREESAFDAGAVSPANAYGLMQLIVPTAKSVGKKLGLEPDALSLKTPEMNIALGCRFLSDLQKRFSNNPALAIPSYNAGPGAPLKWIASRKSDDFDLWVEQIPYEETRKYTQRVLTSYAAYLFLYERDRVAHVLSLPAVVN